MIPKYRIWSKTLHVMGEMTELRFFKNTYHQVTFRYTDPTRKGIDGKSREVDESHLFDEDQDYMPVIFMRSTGLKDRNGVEIFEGDILQAHDYPKDSMRFPVVWYDNSACFNLMGLNTKAFVIAGNIHEEKADTT